VQKEFTLELDHSDFGFDEFKAGFDIEDTVLGNRVRNILAVYDDASPSEKEEGLGWYRTANTFAKGIASESDVSVRAACGVIAALSPQVSWDRNQVIARQVITAGSCVGQTGANVDKAKRIIEGDRSGMNWNEPLDILGGPKVRSFYRNMVFPDIATTVTIDRHAVAIALGGVEAGKEETKKLNRKGAYEQFEEAYRQAAVRRDVLPHECQAVAWVTWRYRNGEFFENLV
jgi:hypothetical protein